MTVTYTKTKHIYPGDGERRRWKFLFPLMTEDALRLWRVDARGNARLKTKSFFVDLDKKEVIYPMPGTDETVPEPGEYVVLQRATPLTQEFDAKRHVPLDNQTLEDAQDLSVMRAQELAEELSRALKFPVQYQGTDTDAAAYLARITELKETAVSAAEEAAARAEESASLSQNSMESAREAVADAQSAVESLAGYKTQTLAAKDAAQAAASAAAEDARQCALDRTACDAFASSCSTDCASARSAAQNAGASQTAAAASAAGAEISRETAQSSETSALSAAAQAQTSARQAAQSAQDAADKAQTDFSNVAKLSQSRVDGIMPDAMDYVVESGRDGANWWRKWRSGKIEQGGVTTVSNGTTQNFLLPFTDFATIGFLATTQFTGGNSGDASASVCGRALSVTTFGLNWAWRNYSSAAQKWAWLAVGY